MYRCTITPRVRFALAFARARTPRSLGVRIRGNAASTVAALLSSAATMKNYPEATKEREIARDEGGRKKRESEREEGKTEQRKKEEKRPSERRVEDGERRTEKKKEGESARERRSEKEKRREKERARRFFL